MIYRPDLFRNSLSGRDHFESTGCSPAQRVSGHKPLSQNP